MRSEEEVDEAVEIQNVSNEHSPSAKVLHIRSFPYGDEEENDDTDDSNKSVDLSEVKGQDGEDLFDEEAVKVTAAGIASLGILFCRFHSHLSSIEFLLQSIHLVTVDLQWLGLTLWTLWPPTLGCRRLPCIV